MPPVLKVHFYKLTAGGSEPVLDWLRAQNKATKLALGGDIKTVEIGWPLGMPLVRKLDTGLWEIRSDIPAGIARILFTVVGSKMILLHAFVKKSDDTPKNDLDLAKRRRDEVKKNGKV
jgi:phage-related protein